MKKLYLLLAVVLTFGISVSLYAQNIKTLKGQVTSDEGTLPGVNIMIKGTTTGTVTDVNGNYSIQVSPGDSLIFSFIGYIQATYAVNNQSVLDVTLSPETINLEELVVVGYGTVKKAASTGAISAVKGNVLEKAKTANFSNSIAGRVSGVVATTSSGEPGEDGTRLLIRGMSTTGDNSPLIVIDGVANRLGGLDRLNADDIESVSVLKDASAAIYGAQAANGVILVTTKKGMQGKPGFEFNYNQGIAQPTRLPQMADAATYSMLINEINYYRNPAGGLRQIYSDSDIQKYADGSDPLNYPNTNWEKETLKPFSLQDRETFSVRGGSKAVNYFASVGRLHQDGLYKNGILKYNQIILHSNTDFQITENLKAGLNLSYRNSDRYAPVNDQYTIFRAIYRTYPQIPAYYPGVGPSAGVESGLNPIILVTDAPGTDKNDESVINTLLNFEYRMPFAKAISLKGFMAMDYGFNLRETFSTPYICYSYDKSTDEYTQVNGGPVTPELTNSQYNNTLKTYNLSLNFEKSYGKSNIKAFLAFEQSESQATWFTAFRKGFISTQIPVLDMGGSDPLDKTVSGNNETFRRRNYFGRLSYDYSQKYLTEFQFRYDGSSIFAPGKQYGLFPSASVAWRLSEEDWFNVGGINNLKIRASYGLLGNDRVTPFQYLNAFGYRTNSYVVGGIPVSTFFIEQLANPDITWEKAKKLDIGLEINFLENFKAELDYFSEVRNDLLIPRTGSIPWVSGIVNEYNGSIIPYENIGKVSNRGIEVQLGYDKLFGGMHFYANGNFTYNKSNVEFMDDPEGIPEYQKQVGMPLGAQLLYQQVGIIRNEADLEKYPTLPGNVPGDFIYKDMDGDVEITADDRVREPLSNVPQIIYGFTTGIDYRSFDFNMTLQGQARVAQYVMPESGEIGNFFSTWADNRWRPTNTNGNYPRVDTRTSSSINGGLYRNNFWLDNTAFLRIRSIEIGYTAPKSLLSKLGVDKTRIYINISNLYTFTKIKDYDPEGNSESAQFYPQLRTFNFGITMGF